MLASAAGGVSRGAARRRSSIRGAGATVRSSRPKRAASRAAIACCWAGLVPPSSHPQPQKRRRRGGAGPVTGARSAEAALLGAQAAAAAALAPEGRGLVETTAAPTTATEVGLEPASVEGLHRWCRMHGPWGPRRRLVVGVVHPQPTAAQLERIEAPDRVSRAGGVAELSEG